MVCEGRSSMKAPGRPPPRHRSHERRLLTMILMGGLAGCLVALLMLWLGDHSAKVRWTLTPLIVLTWLGCAFAAREPMVRSLQIASNLLAALREGDFSIRAPGAESGDALGELYLEGNPLAATLRGQRPGALEASVLLRQLLQ